ncbi:MAG: NDP-sugar synthase [Acidimicrobiales bacterium]
MIGVVLVGGFGTRLRPLTLTVPKNLVPVAGVPLIERVIARLAAHGIDRVVLSLGYRPDSFFAAFPDDTAAGVPLTYVVEPEPLDTAGAIRFAVREAGLRDTFVVANGDVLTDLDITALIDTHRRTGAEGTIALTPVDDPSRFGVVTTDQSGRVSDFIEKPPKGEAPTNLINAGTYVFEHSVLRRIAADRRVSLEREIFPAMVADGTLFAVPSERYWLDVGLPDSYLRATADLLDGSRDAGPPAPGADRRAEGGWTLGEPVVDPTAAIDDQSLLCDGCRVGANVEARRSVVGPASRVADGVRLDDAVLLAGAILGEGAVVERSIVGPGAVVGAGAKVSGLSILGEGAVIAAGTSVDAGRLPTWDD